MSNEPQKVTFSQAIHEESSVQKEILGTLRVLSDGRKFRYCQNGGVALVAGQCTQGAAAEANHVDCTVAANAAVGARSVSLTLGATAATLNQYKDGLLQINSGAGAGLQYPIDGHPAIGSAGTGLIQIKDSIRVALTTAGSSKASLIYNLWDGVVQSTGEPVAITGIPPIAVTAAYYFWIQTGGIACALVTNAVALGQKLTAAANGVLALAAAHDDPIVGYTIATAGVTDEFKPVMLTID